MNNLNKDLSGRVVLIRKDVLKEEYHDDEKRAFLVRGGFGASPHTTGSALVGTFLYDGEETRMEGQHVDPEAGIVADSLSGYDGPVHESVG